MRRLVPLLIACHPAPPVSAPLSSVVKIESVPPLDIPVPSGANDCRLSNELRVRFPRISVHPCGSLGIAATAEQREAARRCVVASIERGEAFLIEQRLPDKTGVVAHALLGVAENAASHAPAALQIYRAEYDAPECIGPCPVIRNLRLVACPRAALQPCSDDLAACVRCDGEEFASCSNYLDDRMHGE